MSTVIPFSSWLTLVVLPLLWLLFIYVRKRVSKRKLIRTNFMTSMAQALFVWSCLVTGINLIFQGATEKLDLPYTLIEPVHPLIYSGFFVLALALWVIYENLRKLWKKG